jgi:hypothetical protein
VLEKTVFEIGGRHNALSDNRLSEHEVLRHLPDVPVLPETLLLMELKVHEPHVSLREISQLLLGDFGAALQIFRLADHEYGSAAGRPDRIEDCISDLGLQACLEAASRKTVNRGPGKGAIFDAWAHARTIGNYCSLLAEETSATIIPGEAYLTGLFHELGSLPALLGWDWMGQGASDPASMGLRMADEWALPRCVRDFFSEMHVPGSTNQWSEVVELAHQLASISSTEVALGNGLWLQPHTVA